MAITIQNQPTSPNLANSDMLFTLTSTQVSQPQYQFVLDIKDNNDNLIQRIKQQPNPSGRAVFNIGQIITQELGPTDQIWDVGASARYVAENTGSAKLFKIYAGEEYGTSVSSSVTMYNGLGGAGDPSKTGSLYYFNLDGFLNESAALDWNWASGSKLDYEYPSTNITYSYQNGLTNFTTSSLRWDDYHTISFLNGNVAGEADSATAAQDVFGYRVYQYDASGTLVNTDEFYNLTTTGGGPRNSASKLWTDFDAYRDQTEGTKLVHFGVGPRNFLDATYALTSSTAYYDVEFYGQRDDTQINRDGVWGKYRFNIVDPNCGYDGVRFAWKNQYGVWDYFNFGLAETTDSTIERKEYKQSFVDYSTAADPPYDRERRGKNNYYNKVTKRRTANSDWLTQSDADNVRELFFSTNVFVQQANGEWWPAVITDANLTEKTNPRTQKMFQYTIGYEYANGQRPRL